MYYSREIEYVVIATLLAFREEFWEYYSYLSENDFCSKETQHIFKVMKSLPQTADITLILSEINDETEKDILWQSTNLAIQSKSNLKTYIIKLKSQAQSYRLKNKLLELALETDKLPEIEDVKQLIEEIEKDSNIDFFLQTYENGQKELLKGFADRIIEPKELFKTGFSDIDNLIFGFERATISILGAYPSVGKTTFALNIATTFIGDMKKTLVFSLEMSIDMIYKRFMAAWCEMDYSKIINQRFSENEKNTVKKFGEMMLFIADVFKVYDDIYDIESIEAKIKEQKPDFVIIDYIQIVNAEKAKARDRRTEIDYIVNALKRIAKETNCHIMILSQLARGAGKNATMSSLKESGALEANGDYIMILNRPYVQDKSGEYQPSEAELLIDKNKFGNTGKVDLYFSGEYQKFSCVDNRWEQE